MHSLGSKVQWEPQWAKTTQIENAQKRLDIAIKAMETQVLSACDDLNTCVESLSQKANDLLKK